MSKNSKVSNNKASSQNAATPMMEQYLAIKRDYPDIFLFYRMGDFYELFFEDAVNAASILDIALTKRGKHLGSDIPMCGVPVQSHETYLNRLIKKGFKVSVCEQTENPADAKKRGSKAVVRREVLRVITPGTLSEDTLLNSKCNNYLAAIAYVGGDIGIAWVDISTGEFLTQELGIDDLGAVLIIALFYSSDLSAVYLSFGLFIFLLLVFILVYRRFKLSRKREYLK